MQMKTILIVDDNADIRDLLRMTLDLAQSFTIHEAQDGLSAVAAAAELQPDLVLMDIMMPGEIDGAEACKRIKQAAGAKAPKVILVSAKPTEEIKAAVAASGADLFMNKPFGPLQLVDRIMALYAP